MLISYDTRLFLDCRTPPVHRHYDTMCLAIDLLMPGYPPRHVRDAMARSIGRVPAVYKGRLFWRCVRGAARCVRGRCAVRVFARLALSENGVENLRLRTDAPKPSRPESRRVEPSLSERPSQARFIRFKHGARGPVRLRKLRNCDVHTVVSDGNVNRHDLFNCAGASSGSQPFHCRLTPTVKRP